MAYRGYNLLRDVLGAAVGLWESKEALNLGPLSLLEYYLVKMRFSRAIIKFIRLLTGFTT